MRCVLENWRSDTPVAALMEWLSGRCGITQRGGGTVRVLVQLRGQQYDLIRHVMTQSNATPTPA